MEDLIRRSNAIDEISHITPYRKYKNGKFNLLHLKREVIKAIKAIPAVEQKQGEWIIDEYQNILMKNLINKGEKWRVCSICGAGHKLGYIGEKGKYHSCYSRFCPCCGAKMKGADNEIN